MKKTKDKPKEEYRPISFETFRNIGAYEISNWEGENKPSCFNRNVSIHKYKVTIEPIEEPKEVLAERLQKLWDECDNSHHLRPLRNAANEIGYELQGGAGSKTQTTNMPNKEVLVSFMRKHFSLFITDPERVAEDFLNNNESPISMYSMYSEGQQAKVKKRIESGEHVVRIGDIFTKVGGIYKMPLKSEEIDGQTITTYLDIPSKDVEGNAEHFTFANAEGVFLDHENIVKLVPTPALK